MEIETSSHSQVFDSGRLERIASIMMSLQNISFMFQTNKTIWGVSQPDVLHRSDLLNAKFVIWSVIGVHALSELCIVAASETINT